jgi:hypothetical protein
MCNLYIRSHVYYWTDTVPCKGIEAYTAASCVPVLSNTFPLYPTCSSPLVFTCLQSTFHQCVFIPFPDSLFQVTPPDAVGPHLGTDADLHVHNKPFPAWSLPKI